MKKMSFALLVTAMACAAVISTPSWAQGAPNGKGKNMPTFADFDLNGDGGITEDEFNTARAERMAKHAQEGRQMKNMANAPSFADIDTDDDGVVSTDEFNAHQAEQMQKMTDAKKGQQK